jgi:WD40 repeat protein
MEQRNSGSKQVPIALRRRWEHRVLFAFSPDGQILVMPNSTEHLRMECRNPEVKRRLRGYTRPVGSVAFSPDGQSIASVAGSFYATNAGRVTGG